jgi:hypothetical protein
MSKRKRSSPRQQANADDHLLRALRQVADEALEETVPDRLLQVIRAARRQHVANGEPLPPDAGRAPPEESS